MRTNGASKAKASKVRTKGFVPSKPFEGSFVLMSRRGGLQTFSAKGALKPSLRPFARRLGRLQAIKGRLRFEVTKSIFLNFFKSTNHGSFSSSDFTF